MKRILIILMSLVGLFGVASLEAKKTEAMQYELQGAGTGVQGTYLVEVSVLSGSRDVNDGELVKAAVHGVLFRGFTNPAGRNTQKPLAGSPANEAEHADFYKDFFGKNGTSSQFGSVVTGTRIITKAGKQYKVSAKVSVNKDLLLKYLQDAGVIKGLNSAF